MNYQTIVKLQKEYGFAEVQQNINSGICWKMEGSVGRYSMSLLEVGVCMLPLKSNRDAYGNTVPSRKDLKSGTKGTFKNSVNFWMRVIQGEINLDDF